MLEIFIRAIFSSLRRRARRHGIVGGRPGSVTFIQRFGSALNLNVHFHVLVPDGVFPERAGEIVYLALGAPTDDEVDSVVRQVARRTLALMACSRRLGRSVPRGVQGVATACRPRERLVLLGQEMPAPFVFHKEKDGWKVDLTAFNATMNKELAAAAKKQNLTEDQLAMNLLRQLAGRPVPDKIWRPLLPAKR